MVTEYADQSDRIHGNQADYVGIWHHFPSLYSKYVYKVI